MNPVRLLEGREEDCYHEYEISLADLLTYKWCSGTIRKMAHAKDNSRAQTATRMASA